MKPAVDLNELMERIHQGADRQNGLAANKAKDPVAELDLPPVPEPVLPPSPPLAPASARDAAQRPESLLDQAAAWTGGGRQKNKVSASVPKLLRPLFRNQGGFNSVLLEAVECLTETNRALRQQNFELQERLMYLEAWAHSVAQTSAENRDWMLAAEARLQASPRDGGERDEPGASSTPLPESALAGPATTPNALQHIEDRLSQLTARAEATDAERRALNDHLNRLRAQLNEQADYARTVHHHLDQLGAHVEASLAHLSRPA